MNEKQRTIQAFSEVRNRNKLLFTPGPASLLPENLTGLRPCFGRGDKDYDTVEEQVLSSLKAMTGHGRIARMQGSASLALEIMSLNFLFGKVLIVSTGYYSDRLQILSESAARRIGAVKEVVSVNWQDLDKLSGTYDWIWACPTETSCGLKIPIRRLGEVAKRHHAKLMLDATASIGLEGDHDVADAVGYSTCKGLFGLTGGSFIAFNEEPTQEVDSFYLNITTHLEKRMTGPYHAIASLADVLASHADFRQAVVVNKERFCQDMQQWLTRPADRQPLLCTQVSCKLRSNNPNAVLYQSRGDNSGSLICHLGEVHLGREATGDILDVLQVQDD